MCLLAVISFALGLCGIGAYTAHHKRMVLADQEAEKQKQQAKEKRAEELAAEILEEQERRENAAASSSVTEQTGEESSSETQEDEEETTYTDLSKLAQQDLQPLVEETGAIQMETGGEYAEYHTENDAVILAYTETGYSVSLDSECIYSLYGVHVGMTLDDALDHLDSRGFRQTDDMEEICYQIDDIDLLYVFENGGEVTGLRLDVLVEDIEENTEDEEDPDEQE